MYPCAPVPYCCVTNHPQTEQLTTTAFYDLSLFWSQTGLSQVTPLFLLSKVTQQFSTPQDWGWRCSGGAQVGTVGELDSDGAVGLSAQGKASPVR